MLLECTLKDGFDKGCAVRTLISSRDLLITMAGGNSINKTKYKNKAFHHAKILGKKRAATVRNTKLALGRYHEHAAPTPTQSTEVALFTGEHTPSDAIHTQTLSKKKAKKLARNQKYVQARNGEINMDVEEKEVKQGQVERVKKALWTLVETWQPKVPQGQGTTLGA